MEFSLIDHFSLFHKLSKEYELSASARSVYFAILGEFNAADYPDELKISDRYMLELSGVKSTATVHDARNLLKLMNLIDFRKGKNHKTVYKLLNRTQGKHLANTYRTPTDIPSEQSGLFPIPTRECGAAEAAAKESSPRTPLKEKSSNQPVDSACEGSERGGDGEVAQATAGVEPFNLPESEESEMDEIAEYWEKTLKGGRLTVEHLSELSIYLKAKGGEWVKEKLKEASDVNKNPKGMQPKFLFGFLKREKESGEKGEETRKSESVFEQLRQLKAIAEKTNQ